MTDDEHPPLKCGLAELTWDRHSYRGYLANGIVTVLKAEHTEDPVGGWFWFMTHQGSRLSTSRMHRSAQEAAYDVVAYLCKLSDDLKPLAESEVVTIGDEVPLIKNRTFERCPRCKVGMLECPVCHKRDDAADAIERGQV